MLSFFDSFSVPTLPKFTIYKDDEDSTRFYVVPSEPRLARDEENRPLLDLMIYARDVDKLPPADLEAQRGWVAASIELGMTDEEEQQIRDYIKANITGPQFLWFNTFFRLAAFNREPKITLPSEWVDGTATLMTPTPGGTSLLATSKPSLLGTNVVTLSGDLSQDASELMRKSVLSGGIPMTATYNDLTFVARIPAITVEIHGDRSAFLSETIKKYQIEHHIEHTVHVDAWFVDWTYKYWTSWTENHKSIDSFQQETQSITMKIDAGDFRTSPEAVAAVAKFEEMALNIFTTSVVPSIMKDVSAVFQAQKDALKDADPKSPPPPTEISELTSRVNGSVDMTLSKSAVIQVKKNPNGMIARNLTPAEIAEAITYVDLSDPYFKEMRLRVQANVNFENDPVYRLTVTVLYDELDAATGQPRKGTKTFAFNSADDIQTFRQILARDSEGKTIDKYQYFSEIFYKETGEHIRVPVSGTLESNSTELIVSYRSLGFVKVGLTLAPMPEKVVSVRVALNYPGSTRSTAKQTFEMTKAAPTATFFTYTGKDGEPDPYTYDITYVLDDGQQMSVKQASSISETLIISNPFESQVTTTFVAQADFSIVDKIIVDATYNDSEVNDLALHFHAELTSNGASSPWATALRNPDKLDFSYITTVLYKTGASEAGEAKPGTLGGTVLAGVGAVAALEVLLVPNLQGAEFAIVQLQYLKPDGTVEQATNFRVTNADVSQTFKVLLKDPSRRGYKYRYQIVGGATPFDSGWQDATDSVLMVTRTAATVSATPVG